MINIVNDGQINLKIKPVIIKKNFRLYTLKFQIEVYCLAIRFATNYTQNKSYILQVNILSIVFSI